MHILVVNDDGPPSNQSSPYVQSLVQHLQSRSHLVSVILPHTQRSWISKAHIVGQTIKPSYYKPGTLHHDDGTISSKPLPASSPAEEWILVDSTPASCVQLGLHHYFQQRGPIDVVVSGPNYGRNTTSVFALSSGTLGAALEAAVCGVRAIALSFAFFDRNHDPAIIAGASAHGVRLIEWLCRNWAPDVHLYSVNVPLVEAVGSRKVLWTEVLQNAWRNGSCFQESAVPEDEDEGPAEREAEIRSSEGTERQGQGVETERDGEAGKLADGQDRRDESSGRTQHIRFQHKHFKWAPKFKDVYDSVAASEPGNDGWAVKEGFTSVTPLKANFMHVSGFKGELKL